MLSVRVALLETIWYVPMMQPKSLPAHPASDVSVERSDRRLSVVHAEALYRPVPPVGLDDDGFVFQDGRVSDSTRHGESLAYGLFAAKALLAHLPDALVASDLAFLFERDNPRAVLSPDLMVALGVGGQHRLSYKLWEERKVPDFALEALSVKTWRRDMEVKPGLYRDLGIREFWIVDLLDRLPAPIIGRRLNDAGVYEEIPVSPSGGVRSDVLGAELFIEDELLRFRDLNTGQVVPPYVGSMRLREREGAALEAAEKRIAELEQRLRRSEGPQGR